MREKFEALAEACARSASLEGSLSAPAQAAANGHSSSSSEARVRPCGFMSPSEISSHFLPGILHGDATYLPTNQESNLMAQCVCRDLASDTNDP